MAGDSFSFRQGGDNYSQQISNIRKELQILRGDFQRAIAPGYTTLFNTFSPNADYTLQAYNHKLSRVTSVFVFNTLNENVEVFYKILSDNSVYVKTGIPVTNFTIIVN